MAQIWQVNTHTHADMHTHLPTTEPRAGSIVPEGGRRDQEEGRHKSPLPPQPYEQSCRRGGNLTLHTFSPTTHTHMPTDGEHTPTHNVLFPCVWEDLRYTHVAEYVLGETFSPSWLWLHLKRSWWFIKGTEKRGKKENPSRGKKASSLSHTVFLQSEVIQRRDPLWTRPPGLDLIRELQIRFSFLPPSASSSASSIFSSPSSLSIAFSLQTNWNIQRREERIWLKAVWILMWSMFLCEQPWRGCVSPTPQVFQWRQLENLYFREKKFSVEVHDPRR